jgi:hypothetical protein
MAYQHPRLRPERFLGLSWEQITTTLRGPERQQALALWQWAAPRYSSLGTAQERYFNRYGAGATYARIDRTRQWLNLKPYGEA